MVFNVRLIGISGSVCLTAAIGWHHSDIVMPCCCGGHVNYLSVTTHGYMC